MHISGPAGDSTAPGPGTRGVSLMPIDDTTRRRHALLVDVTEAASEVSRLIHEARDLNLPVEPGVRQGRDALVRWAVLLEAVIP